MKGESFQIKIVFYVDLKVFLGLLYLFHQACCPKYSCYEIRNACETVSSGAQLIKGWCYDVIKAVRPVLRRSGR